MKLWLGLSNLTASSSNGFTNAIYSFPPEFLPFKTNSFKAWRYMWVFADILSDLSHWNAIFLHCNCLDSGIIALSALLSSHPQAINHSAAKQISAIVWLSISCVVSPFNIWMYQYVLLLLCMPGYICTMNFWGGKSYIFSYRRLLHECLISLGMFPKSWILMRSEASKCWGMTMGKENTPSGYKIQNLGC